MEIVKWSAPISKKRAISPSAAMDSSLPTDQTDLLTQLSHQVRDLSKSVLHLQNQIQEITEELDVKQAFIIFLDNKVTALESRGHAGSTSDHHPIAYDSKSLV